MRCFIAISLPESIRRQLGELQNNLKKFHADIRWTRPEGIHLTLKFFGEIPPEKIQSIKESLDKISQFQKPFSLEINGSGIFPDAHRPRVFWVGIRKGLNELLLLAEEVEKEMETAGFLREGRKFNPHLTLGRVRSSKDTQDLTDYFLNKINPNLGSIEVDHMTLYQSLLKPTGAVYTVLHNAKFEK